MTNIDPTKMWTVMVCLALGSFGLRFAFIGIVGDRKMPEWLMRYLRYTAVAIIPALVSPMVVWPVPTGGQPSPIHLAAAVATLAVAYVTKNAFAAMVTGAAILIWYSYLLGQ